MADLVVLYDVSSPERAPNPAVALVYARYFAARQGLVVPDGSVSRITPTHDGSGRYRVETSASYPA